MKFFRSIFKYLPLKYLYLGLSNNELGGNIENLQFLGDSFKYLPNLKYLKIDLICNNLGTKSKNIK